MPHYNPVGNTTTAPNSFHTESPPARHDATSWMKEASISGSNDLGGSVDSGWDSDGGGGDYDGGGDVGGGNFDGGGDVGGGGDMGGSADANASTATNGSEQDSNCLPITGTDQNGNLTSNEATTNVTDKHPNNSHGGSPNDYSGVDSYGIGESALDADTSDTSLGATNSNDNSGMDSGSHGGASNEYDSVNDYGIGSGNVSENTNADSSQSTTGGATSGYQNAMDAASQLLGKPQGTVSYDDVLGALTQIRGASQNPELRMREQQAPNSMFMAVYTRGNTERVIGPTVTNEFLNAAMTSMMFGGGISRIPKPNLPTGPVLQGTNSDFARFRPPARETWQQSERDIGRWLGANNRGQVSYLGGREVPHGTPGSVRPDFVSSAGIASFEVKNYNIATNMRALIQNVSSQAIDRAQNLPAGMRQQIIIDIRGQSMSDAQRAAIINGIVQRSNGIIQPGDILFIR
jgi:hypothetical protein